MLKIILCFACLASANAQAATMMDSKYDTLQSALSDCRSAWTQAGRERALEIIESNGAYLAATLNPMAADADRQMEMMKDATAALNECSRLAYPKAD